VIDRGGFDVFHYQGDYAALFVNYDVTANDIFSRGGGGLGIVSGPGNSNISTTWDWDFVYNMILVLHVDQV